MKSNIYKHPSGLFEVEVPVDTSISGKIVEKDDSVRFYDDFCNLLTIENGDIGKEMLESWEYNVDAIFSRVYFGPVFRPLETGAKIEYKEPVNLSFGNGMFFVVSLPQGAACQISYGLERSKSKKYDAKIGIVTFIQGEKIYYVWYETLAADEKSSKGEGIQEWLDDLKRGTISFAETIKINIK